MEGAKRLSRTRFKPREVIFIAVILLVAATVRIQFASLYPGPAMTNDSASYIRLADRILRGGIPLDNHRTPIYPLFIAANWLLFGLDDLEGLVMVQYGMGCLSMVLVYLAIRNITGSPILAFLGSLICSLEGNIVCFERAVMTEGVAMFCFYLVILAGTWLFASKPSIVSTIFLAILSLQAIYTRPVFLYLVVPCLVLTVSTSILDRAPPRRVLLHCAVYVFVLLIPISGTLYVNYHHFGTDFGEFSTVMRKNEYGKILQYNMMERIPDSFGALKRLAIQYRNEGVMSPTIHLTKMSKALGAEVDIWREMGRMSRATVSRYPVEYVIKTVGLMPSAYQEVREYFVWDMMAEPGVLWNVVSSVDRNLFGRAYSFSFWVTLMLSGTSLILAWIMRLRKHIAAILFVFASYAGYVFTVAAAAYGHYARFLYLLTPLVVMALAVAVGLVGHLSVDRWPKAKQLIGKGRTTDRAVQPAESMATSDTAPLHMGRTGGLLLQWIAILPALLRVLVLIGNGIRGFNNDPMPLGRAIKLGIAGPEKQILTQEVQAGAVSLGCQNRIGQTFTAAESYYLSSIEIVVMPESWHSGMLEAALTVDGEALGTAGPSSKAENPWGIQRLKFTPPAHFSAGDSYSLVLWLSCDEQATAQTTPVEVITSGSVDAIPSGSLHVDTQPSPGDLWLKVYGFLG